MEDKKSSLGEGETKSLLYLHFISLGLVIFFKKELPNSSYCIQNAPKYNLYKTWKQYITTGRELNLQGVTTQHCCK